MYHMHVAYSCQAPPTGHLAQRVRLVGLDSYMLRASHNTQHQKGWCKGLMRLGFGRDAPCNHNLMCAVACTQIVDISREEPALYRFAKASKAVE